MTYRPCGKCIGPECLCHEVGPEKLDGRTIQEWAYIARGFGEKSDRLEAERDALVAERDALVAHVERIYDAWAIDDTGIHDKRVEHVRLPYLRYEAVDQAIMAAPAASLARHDANVIAALRFPTMLRKMWSGGEVQRWLDDQAAELEAQCNDPDQEPG